MCFPQCASTTTDKREEKAFEECCWFVKRSLECIVEMNVQFSGFVDIITDSIQNDRFEELLGDMRFRRYKDSRCFIARVWCPGFRSRN